MRETTAEVRLQSRLSARESPVSSSIWRIWSSSEIIHLEDRGRLAYRFQLCRIGQVAIARTTKTGDQAQSNREWGSTREDVRYTITEDTMKTLATAALGAVLFAAIASPSQAQDIIVWRTIIGIEQANNAVGGITGGGQPWSTREGAVLVELTSGLVEFEVRGLVRAGGNSIGTPGTVNQVKGTLVCGLSTASPTAIDTQLVPLDAQGNAQFSGSFSSSTAGCKADVAFLIRTAGGAWIGNGSVRIP
jgi:hypothetical protein